MKVSSPKSKYVSFLCFFTCFILLSILYYDSVLDKSPLNTHIWRQTDCLSLTRNYAEGASFLEPQMDILLADELTTGKTAGEFPILYYFVGKIWSWFGESILFYRVFYLLILFAGLFSFYRSLRLLFNDEFWATGISLLLFTSPLYVNYGVSFLTDVPAFSFILIALHLLHLYHLKSGYEWLVFSVLFFSLAGLIKVSSLILFVFVLFIYGLELIFKVPTLRNKFFFKRKITELLLLASVLVFVFSWYLYSARYNEKHGFKYTFNGIYPLWDKDLWDRENLIAGIKDFTSMVFFSRPMIFLMLAIFIVNLRLGIKRLTLLGYSANILVFIGVVIYAVLWGPLLENHDYYFVAILVIFPATLVPFLFYLKSSGKILQKKIWRISFGLFLCFNILYCFEVTKMKTLAQDGRYLTVFNRPFIETMHWTNQDVSANLKRFEEMKPYLNEIGVEKDDKVISIPDPSFNSSLFLMNRKGWTNYMNIQDSESIYTYIEKGAKFLLISDDSYLEKDYLNPFLKNEIGNFNGIRIFKL